MTRVAWERRRACTAGTHALLLILCFIPLQGSLAQEGEGPHAAHSRQHPYVPEWSSEALGRPRATGDLTHIVHGYHPYWIPDTAAAWYRFDLLSHLAYFSCEIDPSTGVPTNTRAWLSSSVPTKAKAAGVKVLLTVTNFGAAANRSLLGTPEARETLYVELLRLIALRDADGVSIDFESVPADQRENLTSFFVELKAELTAWKADAVLSAAVPAVDWSGAWDVRALSETIDLFFLMGYDYSWSGSSSAGPVAPLRGFSLNVERSLQWYLDQGVPRSRLLLGVPYYGYDWPVSSDVPGASTTDRGVARVYSTVQEILVHYPAMWSDTYLVPWISYRPSGWRQCWYDDARSLALKYEHVLSTGIAGIGIWALGYDGTRNELWNEIATAFARPVTVERRPMSDVPLSVYPVPLRSGEGFNVIAHSTQPMTMSLVDILGVEHARQEILRRVGDREVVCICPVVPAGLYILRLTNGNDVTSTLVPIR